MTDLISNTRTIFKWWLSACGRFVSHTKEIEHKCQMTAHGRVPHPNYVDPECCIATVCHQVRCMYWGHLGHFHRAISHLKWHKLFVWDISSVHLVRWNLLTCFPCICNLEFPDISYGVLLRVEHRTSLFSCLCMSMLTPNSGGNMQKHGYLGCFHAASARENISGVWGIRRHGTHTFRLQPSSILSMWLHC